MPICWFGRVREQLTDARWDQWLKDVSGSEADARACEG